MILRSNSPGIVPLAALLLAGIGTAWAQDQPQQTAEESLFGDLPVVEAAVLRKQTLKEAPANVTLITAEDISKYGYRTLGEALSSVRGFYMTSDHIYGYVGTAGINIPGDYNTKFLVMINGHNMTEHIYDSNGFFEQDFGLDMDLIARIEVIRGPSSALYGSNGMLATINIVTKSPVDLKKLQITAENGTFGERKGEATSSLYLGKGANLLLSTSIFNFGGQDLFVPQFDSPFTNFGQANNVDGQRGYHSFANLVWQNWTFTAYFNSREKYAPVPWGGSIFPDRGASVTDSRNFVNASYAKSFAGASKLRWQIYYDNYRYFDRFDYPNGTSPIEDVRTKDLNDWLGTDVSYSFDAGSRQTMTVGTQLTYELRQSQLGYEVFPTSNTIFSSNNPDRTMGVYLQDEIKVTERLKAFAGLRFDESRHFGANLSPRLALVYQSSPTTSYKAVYGHPFRNPSAYEQYFTDGGISELLPGGTLHPETANTYELSAEKKVRNNLNFVVSAYQYRLANLIEAQLVGDAQQYANLGQVHSTGIEFEVGGKPWAGLEATASYVYQQANDVVVHASLPNSPHNIAKLRFATTVAHNRLQLSSSTQFSSNRMASDGSTVGSLLLIDATATTRNLFRDFDLQFGARNLANQRPFLPVALVIDALRQDGISFYMKAVWHSRE